MQIAFDVDNVLADTISEWVIQANDSLGLSIKKEDIKHHKISRSIDLDRGIIYRLLDQLWENWEDLPMTEDIIPEFIKELSTKDIVIFIVTCRPLRSMNYVENWLELNEIYYDEFFPLGPSKLKSVVDADYLVDDAPEHIRSYTINGKKAFIYDQPWNKKITDKNAYRITSLEEILGYL